MVKCPNCSKEKPSFKKKWKYGTFDVEAYVCECGTKFRSYKKAGQEVFILKKNKDDIWYTKPIEEQSVK